MAEKSLNYADGVLLNMAAHLVSVQMDDGTEDKLRAGILADVLPGCSREVKFIDALATAADAYLTTTVKSGRRTPDYTLKYYELKNALSDCARWRMGLA